MWRRFRDLRVLGILGVLLFGDLIIQLNVTTYSAEATVIRYLEALGDGRQSDAIAIVWGDAKHPDLIPPAVSANDRPHDPHITGSSVKAGLTTVTATALLGDDTVNLEYTLKPAAGWFPLRSWNFITKPIASIQTTVTPSGDPSFNGQSGSLARYGLVPSRVTVGSSTPWFSTTTTVVNLTESRTNTTAELVFTPTKQLTADVSKSVHAYLDSCAKHTTLVPARCPFAGFTFDTVTKGPVWTIDTYPDISITEQDGEWVATGSGIAQLEVSLVDFATETTRDYSEFIPFEISSTLGDFDTPTPTLTLVNTVER